MLIKTKEEYTVNLTGMALDMYSTVTVCLLQNCKSSSILRTQDPFTYPPVSASLCPLTVKSTLVSNLYAWGRSSLHCGWIRTSPEVSATQFGSVPIPLTHWMIQCFLYTWGKCAGVSVRITRESWTDGFTAYSPLFSNISVHSLEILS